MADIAYHRKYRPRTLSEYMIEEIRNTVLNRFKDERNFPQTILLHGTRGCGKTSLARLLTLEYDCMDKVDGHACGKCEMCLELEEKLINGQAGVEVMGVTEVDVASDGGKGAIEDLIEEALIEPLYPLKYKIIILDECHMLTNSAQNRLLKIVEEPPKHLIIIFCTTDPEKMLGTLKSRCQLKIEVKKPSVDVLAERLLYVCQQEKIECSMEALKIIGKKADRIPREALNILESVAKDCGYKVTIENVRKKTGDVAAEIYMEYYRSANSSLEDILQFNRKLKDEDIAPKDFIRGLTRFTMDCMYLRYAIGIEDYPLEYVKQVKKFFASYNTEDMDCLLQIVEYANKMINNDDTLAELVINTTAMRIGKVKLLAVGLQNEQDAALAETQRGNKKSIELLKSEQKTAKVITTKVDDSLMTSVFGKNVAEVKSGVKLGITEKEEEEKEKDDRVLSDNELFNMFS